MQLGKATRIVLITRDFQRSLAFYRDTLGLELSGSVDREWACFDCGGMLKPSTVMFGELLPPAEIEKADQFSETADAVLVIGSTMSVYPAAEFPMAARRRGAPMVIVNQGRTDHDRSAHVKIDGPAGEVVPQIVEALTSDR